MEINLFAKWRLRIQELDAHMFGAYDNLELRILLILYLNKAPLERKILIAQFKLDQITMRTHINSLIGRGLIAVSTNAADRRKKHYELTTAGQNLLNAYSDALLKATFVDSSPTPPIA